MSPTSESGDISEQAASISPASLKRQLEDFAYGKI